MGRKAKEELDKKDVNFFKGDWERLKAVLAPTPLTPSEFLRELLRKQLNRIESRAAEVAQPLELSDDDLATIPGIAQLTPGSVQQEPVGDGPGEGSPPDRGGLASGPGEVAGHPGGQGTETGKEG